MGADDQREYIEFFAIYPDDTDVSFGTFVNTHKILVREYLDEGCNFTDELDANETHDFLYPHHIKKIYFIEGVIKGQVTYCCNGGDGYVHSYRVSIYKMSKFNTPTELSTTNWKTVDLSLSWDGMLGVGEEIPIPFYIDQWEEQEVGENERLYLKVETDTDGHPWTRLVVANDPSYNTTYVEIPFRM